MACDKLKVHTINPKAAIKIIQQRVIANKLREEIKRKFKNQLIPEGGRKRKKGTKNKENK